MSTSLTVLGCSTPYPSPGSPCSGYLIRSAHTTVWIDCGSGTFAALQEHVRPDDVDAIWISHAHPDHYADLLTAYNWAANASDLPPLAVYGPPGWADQLAAVLPQDDAADSIRQVFSVHELFDGHAVTVGDVHLSSIAVEHSVPAFGLRVEHSGGVFAYSGDTGPCDALVELARDADLFLCEAGAIEAQSGHCTPEQAGRIARRAGVRNLLLTHLPYAADPVTASTLAATVAGSPVLTASPGMTVTITS